VLITPGQELSRSDLPQAQTSVSFLSDVPYLDAQ
jgi:hypothetical protein